MWKKTLHCLIIVAILTIGSFCGVIGKILAVDLFSSSKADHIEVESKLIEGFTRASVQLNSKLPLMVDKDTRLDKSTVGPGARAVYHHTFPNHSSRDISADFLQTNLWPEVRQKVCSNNDMKKSLQYGGIYVYVYYGSDGKEITRFEINRSDCGYPGLTP